MQVQKPQAPDATLWVKPDGTLFDTTACYRNVFENGLAIRRR